jgi:hypothetical protein
VGRFIGLGLLGLQLAACSVPMRYYADAGRNEAYYAEIKAKQSFTTVRVEVQYLRNGLPDDSAKDYVRDDVLRVLQRTGAFTWNDDPQTPAVLTVVVDDIYETGGKTDADMFYTGMLLGMRSSVASTDNFVFRISYKDASKPVRFGRYQHAVWTTAGDKAATPSNRGPYNDIDDAFAVVMEDVLLNFLKDLNKNTDAAEPVLFVSQPH